MLALALEALLLLALLTLGRTSNAPEWPSESLVSFDVSPPPEAATSPEPEEQAPQATVDEARPVPSPDEPQVAEPQPASPPAQLPAPRRDVAIVPLRRDAMEAGDLANLPRQEPARPPAPAYGPSFAAAPGDTEVVGRAPNGEPLYAARWFREPTHGELAGYLSTASGPGWALIACRTAPQWRVEDCVGLEEYPGGSDIQRAVLAAAWQFQVRPPRRGGESLVGSWVRIRIEYSRAQGPAR